MGGFERGRESRQEDGGEMVRVQRETRTKMKGGRDGEGGKDDKKRSW